MSLRQDDIQKMNQALEEDPTTFDYDDVYEEMQPKLQTKKKPVTGNARYGYGITVSEKGTSKASSDTGPQSRYIETLLSKAKDRETERELVLERQRHKENMKYEEMYGPTESFVTPEYQAKLDEDQRKREELERRDAQGQSGASMANFYANMRRQTFGDSSEAPQSPPSGTHRSLSPEKTSTRDDKTLDAPKNNENENGHDEEQNTTSKENEHPHPSAPASATGIRPKASLIASSVRKPRRHTDEMIEAAKLRYEQRQALRSQEAQLV